MFLLTEQPAPHTPAPPPSAAPPTPTRLNRAVVVDGDGRVQGVVSDADVLGRLDPGSRSGVLGTLMRQGQIVPEEAARDRKSTRLNSSHANISYAVFCLKKKNSTRLT